MIERRQTTTTKLFYTLFIRIVIFYVFKNLILKIKKQKTKEKFILKCIYLYIPNDVYL